MSDTEESPELTPLERAARHRAVHSSRYSGFPAEDLLVELFRAEEVNSRQRKEFKRAALEARQSRQAMQAAEARLRKQRAQLERQIARADKFKSAYDDLRSRSYVKLARMATAPIRRGHRLMAASGKKTVAALPTVSETGAKPLSSSVQNAVASDNKARVGEAKKCYFTDGNITEAMRLVGDLTENPQGNDIVFLRQLAGSARLLESLPSVPPRQPNPVYIPKAGRVLYCAHSTGGFNSNGYSTRTAGLARAMSESGDVAVVARPGYPWDAKTTRKPGTKARFEQVIDGTLHVFNPGPSLRDDALDQYIHHAADIIAREATIRRASLIHSASNHVTALPALIAARRLGIPFVYEVRGLWEITEISGKPHWAGTERFSLAARLEALVSEESDEILAITSQVREELVRRGASGERISLLPNAADPIEFAPLPPAREIQKRTGIGDRDIVVGYAGSILDYEGLDTLVDAFAVALEKSPNLRLLIVGNGPAQGRIRLQVEDRQLGERVIFTGRVAAREIPQFLSVMDVVVCPRVSNTVTEMVSPLKPLEAMSAGRAVIASDVAPLRDLLGIDETRGLLFEAGNPEAFAEVILQLASDSEQRSDLGRTARKWVVENRTWNDMATVVHACHERVRTRTRDSALPGRRLDQVTLALVSDEFTRTSMETECRLVLPSFEGWKQQLASEDIDALVVESAWEGNGGSWRGHVGYYDDASFAALKSMVEYCRGRGIPTIFWNKEDPVHFNRFRRTAKIFDHVFTTDGDRIPDYFAHRGDYCKTIASLPFWAQARIHNPLPARDGGDPTIAYGGTYYGNRYPKRSAELAMLLEALQPFGIAIYDRQANLPDSPYRFPESLAGNVRGGLSYVEMLQAYKTHPVHLNVNSVVDSPTMFSRRVVELAACGTPVISGEGRGVTTMFGELVPVPRDAEAASMLGALWTENEGERNSDAWRLHRYVYRAHLATHRLSYMLRTAGLIIGTPGLCNYVLDVGTLDDWTVGAILNQTHRPEFVRAESLEDSTSGESLRLLREAGVQVLADGMIPPPDVVRINLGNALVDRVAAEDLCRAAEFTDGRVQLFDGDLAEPGHTLWAYRSEATNAPIVSTSRDQPAGEILSLRRAIHRGSPVDKTQDAVRPRVSVLAESRRVLVAGHDLKFAGGIMAWLKDQGHDVVTDVWKDHSNHDVRQSESLLATADAVFCEWSLGNVEWYAQHRRHQRLTSRFHSQELFTPHLKRLDVNLVDQTVFVGEFVRRIAMRRFGYQESRTLVVPNAIGVQLQHETTSDSRRRHTLGLVGIVPRQKHLDRAIELLERLRVSEPKFELRIKGRRPEEYAWMQNRPVEMEFYEELDRRISGHELLKGVVHFDPHGNDMADWYAQVGVVLSVSDFESFHLTLADGAASGALPVSLEWPGAGLIYPSTWLHTTVESMAQHIGNVVSDEQLFSEEVVSAREFVAERFDPSLVNPALGAVILGERSLEEQGARSI